MVGFFFFFKQKTAYEMRISDWSSDVCSSDLAAMAGLGRAMLPVYATALGAAPDYFDGKFDDALAWLRLIHYPTVEDYEEDRFGLGAHTDSGFLTLLPQTEVPGLEVQMPDGNWVRQPVVPGEIGRASCRESVVRPVIARGPPDQ